MAQPHSLMVVLYVHDMERAISFYQNAIGLPVLFRSSGWSQMSCGDASIGLHIIDAGVTERPVPYAGLNLQVEDLDLAIARAVEAGARLVEIREPQPRVPVRLGVLIDPEGNGFELRQQLR